MALVKWVEGEKKGGEYEMTATITMVKSDDGLSRIYTATIKRGKRKGEQFTAKVIDAGQGWGVFWAAAKRHFGTDNLWTE